MRGIKIDGETYDVRIVYETLSRSFEIIEGSNAGTSLSYRSIRDIQGTGYTYSMQVEPNPANPAAYDAFYEKISEPVEYHTVEMPYGQSTITFQAKIDSGHDTYRGKIGGYNYWKGLTITFGYMQPQRT